MCALQATRVEAYNVTCPKGITEAAPTEFALFSSGDFDVIAVTIVIPDGHSGATSIALAIGHQIILPQNKGGFISGNNEEPRFELKGYPRGAAWTVFVANADLISHSWQLRFEFDDSPTVTPTPSTATPINPAAVYALAGNTGP